MQIKGANGYTADVNAENRLLVSSVSVPSDHHLNDSGRVFSMYFRVTPAGADDYFFYFKNEGTKKINITDIRASSTVATALFYDHVTGTPSYVTGTDAETTSRLVGNSFEMNATAKYDTNITGLTSQGVLFFEKCANVDTRYKLSTTSNIIVSQGQAIAFRREAATGELDIVVSAVVEE